MSNEIELTNVDPAKPVLVHLTVSESDYTALKLIRSYFGKNDSTGLEHLAYAVLDRVIKQHVFPPDKTVYP